MRVIAGKYKAKKLQFVKNDNVRPTADMVKGALFSTLFDKVINANFLDLFCGNGQVGIEALSRGANKVVFVDLNGQCVDITKKNLQSMQGNFKVIKSDFKKYLQNCNEQFDIIFLDPPYANNFYLPALEIIFAKNLLAPDGIIVCEHNKQDIIEQDFFEQINTKTYGIKSLTYLKHKNN